ncbi:MAG TPA: hypothetical protein VE863_15230 [Pyrinomonadaceae bacterium]|nr:hypothetical protein [Pyrinomonadaceae bacterium]
MARRTLLMQSGRIGEATVLEITSDGEGNELLAYCYTVAGVDYETVQRLDDEQLGRKEKYLPGSTVALRYDPRRPANSLVV